MNRIATDHLAREAIVYVRQATADQAPIRQQEAARHGCGI